jgi:hypothetical protein
MMISERPGATVKMTTASQDAMESLRRIFLSRPNAPKRMTFAEVIVEAESICRNALGITQPDFGESFTRKESTRA